MRKSKESMEVLPKKEEEKSPLEIMEEIKKKEEGVAKEDKTGTPWNLINPDLITPENRELFRHFNDGELEIAQGELRVAKAKLEKIKNEKAMLSNKTLLEMIDDKIPVLIEIERQRLEDEKK
ncbi:MAG: hypothetical protein Q8N59_02285 [bacterium]|nr:hypothetical protein [bacterium]